MQAGRQLDEMVAHHILDWRKEGGQWFGPDSSEAIPLRPFSSDLTAAWELVDLICVRGFRLQLDGSRFWQARFYQSTAHTLETRAFPATAGHPAAAICLAALASKNVEIPK